MTILNKTVPYWGRIKRSRLQCGHHKAPTTTSAYTRLDYWNIYIFTNLRNSCLYLKQSFSYFFPFVWPIWRVVRECTATSTTRFSFSFIFPSHGIFVTTLFMSTAALFPPAFSSVCCCCYDYCLTLSLSVAEFIFHICRFSYATFFRETVLLGKKKNRHKALRRVSQ